MVFNHLNPTLQSSVATQRDCLSAHALLRLQFPFPYNWLYWSPVILVSLSRTVFVLKEDFGEFLTFPPPSRS